jgi:Polysaccharide lyase
VVNLPSRSNIQPAERQQRTRLSLRGWWGLAIISYGVLSVSACTAAQTVIGSNFESGTIDPFNSEQCCGNSVSVIKPSFPARSGNYAVELKWHQKNYQGTRSSRGVEVNSSERGQKETWYGFSFYLPSRGFPQDKTMIIAQQIAWHQQCSSDKTTVLYVKSNELGVNGYWGNGSTLKGRVGGALTANVPRDRWVDIVIHTIFSRSNKGLLEVWYDGARQTQPTLKLENINIGTGCWSGDMLTYGEYAKFGIYAWEGESRTIYFDNISYLTAAHSNGFALVNPASANFRLRTQHQKR